MRINKNHINANIYYRLDKENELSAFYNYTGGNAYAAWKSGATVSKRFSKSPIRFEI